MGEWRVDYFSRLNGYSIFDRRDFDHPLYAPPIELEVKPLPEAPPNFSGAVGDLRLSARTPRAGAIQGVPMTFEVTVAGSGNPDTVPAPRITGSNWAHISEPDSTTIWEVSGDGLEFQKKFEYIITPAESGNQSIPVFSFVYFDPAEEAFLTESAGPFALEIEASDEAPQRLLVSDGMSSSPGAVDVLTVDIHPVIEARGRIAPNRSGWPWNATAFAVPVLAYAVGFVLLSRRRRFQDDQKLARSHRAGTRHSKRLRAVYGADDPGEVLYQSLIGFIADALNLESAGLTSRDAEEALRTRGVPPDMIDTVVRILRACERSRYGTEPLSKSEVHAMVSGAEEGITAVEGALKRGRVSK